MPLRDTFLDAVTQCTSDNVAVPSNLMTGHKVARFAELSTLENIKQKYRIRATGEDARSPHNAGTKKGQKMCLANGTKCRRYALGMDGAGECAR